MSRDLAVRTITPSVWQMVQAIAPTIHQSRMFGTGSAAAAAAVMLKGAELGMGLTASFEFINVVKSKPTLSPRGALAIVLSSGLLDGMKITETDDACTVWMKRKGEPPHEYETTWTQADSERAGLVRSGEKGDSAHITYPKNMRKWRAVGFCIDVLFSDVCGGMKRTDEFGADLDSEGDVIDGEWAAPVETAQPSPAAELPPSSGVTLDQLLEQYGAEKIIEVNDGRIPGEQAELETVAAKLEAQGAN